MKKISIIFLFITTAFFQNFAYAQTMMTIKAYGVPQSFYTGSSYNIYGVEVKSVSPVNCAGAGSFSTLRFLSQFSTYSEGGPIANPQLGAANANFIAISEIISAAKNGYAVEIVTAFVYSGTCYVTQYNIYVQ